MYFKFLFHRPIFVKCLKNNLTCYPSFDLIVFNLDMLNESDIFLQVRQNYIRRRLMTTYKALERLSQSEFNLDRLEVAAANAASGSYIMPKPSTDIPAVHLTVPGPGPPPPSCTQVTTILRVVKQRTNSKNLPLTVTDVERERGKPLSKYDRNMMIFNWLHTLDDSSFEGQ